MSQNPAAGWYQNPTGPGTRYWDGTAWTDQVATAPPPSPPASAPAPRPWYAKKRWWALAGVVFLALLVSSTSETTTSRTPTTAPKLGGWTLELGKRLWHWIQDVTPDALRQLGEWMAALGSWLLTEGVLGHASAGFTLTVYGHLFDAGLDAVADRLEVLVRDARRPARGLSTAR